jgi:tetratricopeptide (TPR) repeat protein
VLQAQADFPVPLPESSVPDHMGTSTVQGQVHFTDGQPAAGVVVSLVSLDYGWTRRTKTDPSGYYAFLNLQTGDYRYNVEIQQQGYAPVRELVISCDMAPVSLYVTLIPLLPGSAPGQGGSASAGRKVPAKAQAEYQKGVSAMSDGKTAEAAAHFSRAVGICPFYIDSYLKLAATETDQGQFDQAQRMIDRALKLDKNSSLAYAYLGYLRMKQGKRGEAQAQFLHAIGLNPSDWIAQLGLGRLLLSQKQADAALPHLVLAHQLHPALAAVHLLLYNDLILLNKKSAALAELNDFLARFPKAPEAAKLRQVKGPLQAAVLQASSQASARPQN